MSVLTAKERENLWDELRMANVDQALRIVDREANRAYERGYDDAFEALKRDPNPLVRIRNYGRKDEPVTY